MTYGLLSFGVALGDALPVEDAADQYSEDVERIKGYGYRHVLRSPDGTGLTDLATEAAGYALRDAGVGAREVDLLVLAITDIAEYHYWDPAASVAHRLGADRAEVVLLTQACTSGVVSFDATAGRFATHPDYETAVIVTANRTCERYWNRMSTQPMVFSDGAAATVARRGHPRLRWRVTETITDGRYSSLYRMAVGGAAEPFDPSTHTDPSALRTADAWDVLEFLDYDADRFEAFSAEMETRTVDVVTAACRRAGVAVNQLSATLLLADNQTAMASTCARLGIDPMTTNRDLAAEVGHLGAADQLFALSRIADSRQPGDMVALVSRGRGMHWACSIIEA